MNAETDLLGRLRKFAAERDEEPSGQRLAYRRHAALLACFDIEQLTGEPEAHPFDPELLRFLTEDCRIVTGTDGQDQWILNGPVRRSVLADLAVADELGAALAEVPQRPDDLIQSALEALIQGEPLDLRTAPRRELRAVLQATEWLAGIVDGIPDAASVRAAIALSELFDPLRELLASGFEGRLRELDMLREYVGVLPPGSLRRKIRGFVRRIMSLREQPPLLIYGPGGVGKSTLVAKFVIDHYDSVDTADRFPFAYLSFDRAALNPEQPSSLIREIIRQISLQYPEAAADDSDPTIRSLVNIVREVAGDERPLLLVLDTFEEVQRRGGAVLEGIWNQLNSLQQQLPMIRVVIAGRAAVAEFPTTDLVLGELDERAAQGYLRLRVSDLRPGDIRRVIRKVGGSPLRLRLAATLLADPAEDRSLAYLRIDDVPAEAVLYDRILDHIADPEVRAVAHPGLVVRRITPEVIIEVLAVNCGLDDIDSEQAERIFDRFQSEVALVERRAEDPEALYHRQDVRQLILTEIRRTMPAECAAIDDAAVSYYAERYGDVERAEELYHRMMRGDVNEILRSRWTAEAGRALAASFDEVPKPGQVFLASMLGIELDPATRLQAQEQEWCHYTQTEASRLVGIGRTDEALALIRERRGPAGESLLPRLEAEILQLRDDLPAALAVSRQWVDLAVERGRSDDFVQASLSHAWLAECDHQAEEARAVLQRARDALAGSAKDIDLLRVDVALLRVSRGVATDQLADLEREVLDLADSIGPVRLARHRSLLGELVAEADPLQPWLVALALRQLGLDASALSGGAGQLADALVLWEQALNAERDLRVEVLRQAARVPDAADQEDPYTAWHSWLINEPAGQVASWLARLLDEFGPPPEELIQAIADIYRPEQISQQDDGAVDNDAAGQPVESAPPLDDAAAEIIAVFERNQQRFPAQRKPNILVCGQIGVGKTSTINTLFGEEVGKVGYFSRGTQGAELYEWESHGNSIDIVDLPGLGDSPRRDKEYAAMYRRRVPDADGFIIVINPPRPASVGTLRTVNLLLACGVNPERIIFAYNRLKAINAPINGVMHEVVLDGIAGPRSPDDRFLIDTARKVFNDELRLIQNGRYGKRFPLEQCRALRRGDWLEPVRHS